MNGKNVMSFALGMGISGGLMGAYMMMTPRDQRELRKSIKKAAESLADVAEDISDNIKTMR